MGLKTALVTFKRDGIGQMSCNPAIGGLGKGQLVKELDAMFGEMGRAIDETGIQFRTLNSSKGPAVRSSRAQADRNLYQARILKAVENCPNLTVIEAPVGRLSVAGNRIDGIYTDAGMFIGARAVVLTTGTFLRGLMHTGEEKTPGGRTGEAAAYALGDSIHSLGLRMGRMKTGTPPRIKLSSIDFSQTTEQPGDTPIKPFSFRTKSINRPQVSCWITSTNLSTHEVIGENVDRSPMFNGQIQSTGPRYCPSIEDKVFRFRDKTTHNIFLEPEGFESDIVYPNGISTSLPRDVQERFIRTIPGLAQCQILEYGYAVEYDHVDPTELSAALAVKAFEGLFLAGQINGTSGYEEAGAQGIIAGINAARYVRGEAPVTIGRDQAYIGVMIDDLITRGTIEPYRMFTSRAEYRLYLREDNADERLTPLARELGLVDDQAWKEFEARQRRIQGEMARLESTIVKPIPAINAKLAELPTAEIYDALSLAALLRRPELSYETLTAAFPCDEKAAPGVEGELTEDEWRRVETEVKFAGYLKRQAQDIEKMRRMEEARIPYGFPFARIKGLSTEVRDQLEKVQPETLGQAARIYGVTPAALSLLAIHLKRGAAALKAA